MEENRLHEIVHTERSEEVEDLINRMPTHFGFGLSAIVILLFSVLIALGWVIHYPEVVVGQITISTSASPIKLVANTSSNLRLKNGIKSQSLVKKGDLIAYLESSTQIQHIARIDSINKAFNLNKDALLHFNKMLPENLSLGDLNIFYYNFRTALQDLINFEHDDIYHKQLESLNNLLSEQKNIEKIAEKRVDMSLKSLGFVRNFHSRDSILFQNKVIAAADMDKRELEYLSAKDAYQNAVNTHIYARKEVKLTENKITELKILEPEKGKELRIALMSSYNSLNDEIKKWKQKYVFTAPFDGTVQFLKFYENNQFIEIGEKVFSIIPKERKIIGQVILPTIGSGKIKNGQEVIVKLDNFPFMEYGTIKGIVNTISLTSSTTKVQNGEIDTYLLSINFPNNLITNYNQKLNARGEVKGSAEIIINDRRLIDRLFENLKYILYK